MEIGKLFLALIAIYRSLNVIDNWGLDFEDRYTETPGDTETNW